MTRKEKILIADLLDMASDVFSNHGSNDVDPELLSEWSISELQKAAKEYHDYNGDPEEYDGGTIDDYGDFIIMSWLSDKIRQEAES